MTTSNQSHDLSVFPVLRLGQDWPLDELRVQREFPFEAAGYEREVLNTDVQREALYYAISLFFNLLKITFLSSSKTRNPLTLT